MSLSRTFRLLLALPLLLAVAGCDTTEDNGADAFPLTPDRNASFRFDAGTLTAGQSKTVASNASINSAQFINDSRFGPEDVVSARVRRVEINLEFPIGQENEVVLDEVTLTLTADGVQDRVVARAQDVTLVINTTSTAARRATLELVSDDIAPFLRQPSFSAELRLDAASAGSGDYEFSVAFPVTIEVQTEGQSRPF